MTEQNPTSSDDTEGHAFRRTFAEDDRTGDDVEGHAFKRPFADEAGDDDVTGHLSGALGAQQRDDGH